MKEFVDLSAGCVCSFLGGFIFLVILSFIGFVLGLFN